MESRKPRLKTDVDLSKLDLDVEEGFVLSRIDGSTTALELTQLTAFPPDKIERILGRLTDLGALEADGAPDSHADPGSAGEPERAAEEEVDEDGGDEGEVDEDGGDEDGGDEDGGDEETEDERREARSWRAIFENDLHALATDERVELARKTSGETLCALCFDPTSRVVAALLDNPHAALQHARLIAQHHRTGNGLDAVGDQPSLLRDRQVQRLLYRNPQTSNRLLRRILRSKRMSEVFVLCLSREATDRVRSTAKREFRTKFTAGTAEERVSLILKCEGRCLVLLLGVALDSKAVALLCRRPLSSALLVQNLARWPSTPPPVLHHMMRQPLVQRTPALRNLILRHPNAPSKLRDGPA